jgi:hypothetical protein
MPKPKKPDPNLLPTPAPDPPPPPEPPEPPERP